MRYTSRKLLVAIALVALVTWLLMGHVISEAAWLELVKLALGGYLAANVGQKGVEAIAESVTAWLEAKTAAAKPATPAPGASA
jgi:hypothetical protein